MKKFNFKVLEQVLIITIVGKDEKMIFRLFLNEVIMRQSRNNTIVTVNSSF
jgi:hypothetical protein